MPWEVETPENKQSKWVVESNPETPAAARFIRGMRDPVDAGAQLLTHILPEGVVSKGNELNNWLAQNTGLVGEIPKGGMDEYIQNQARNYVAPEGIDWARLGGNIISPVNLAIASRFPQASTLGKAMWTGADVGAIMGGLTPVEKGDFEEEKNKQLLWGAVGGALAPVLTAGLGKMISPAASVNAHIATLKDEGITPTIGQTIGGRTNALEEKMQSLPILGDMISTARRRANNQFQSAAFNRALKPIGEALPKGLSGRDALVYTESALSNKYDDVLTKIGAIKPDQKFSSDISKLVSMVNAKKMPDAEKQKFIFALDKIKSSMDDNGVITSDAYKELESSLGLDATKLMGSQNIYEAPIGQAVKQLQQNLRDMLQRQAGGQAKELSKANLAWANFKRVQNAAGKIGAEGGEFTPAQLQNAVRALDKSKDKAAFARGDALMQDLSDAGKSVLGSKVPNSGTAERLLYGGGALSSYFINPAIPAGLLGSASLYTAPAQKLLNSLVTARPDFAPTIANAVRQGSPYLAPIGAGLLNAYQ